MYGGSNVPMLVIMVYSQNDVMHWQCAKDHRKAKLHGGNYANYGPRLSG